MINAAASLADILAVASHSIQRPIPRDLVLALVPRRKEAAAGSGRHISNVAGKGEDGDEGDVSVMRCTQETSCNLTLCGTVVAALTVLW